MQIGLDTMDGVDNGHQGGTQTGKMFFMVEGYFRASPDTIIGKVINTQACTPVQLSGVVARMLKSGANMCVVVEISEEVFTLFYQERREKSGSNHRQ